VVEEGADLLGGPVDLVGVLIEEGEQELFAPLAVGGLRARLGRPVRFSMVRSTCVGSSMPSWRSRSYTGSSWVSRPKTMP
jgi:hypothetical protein